MHPLPANAAPGTCFKLTVKSAEEAATLIREQLGPGARVLSVRSVGKGGVSSLWSSPRLEVIAQIAAPEPQDVGASLLATAHPVASKLAPTSARPIRSLAELLKRSGMSSNVLFHLQQLPVWSELSAAPLHRGLVEIGRHLQRQSEARPAVAPLTRAAFIGTAGTGRTTALCKWLSTEVFRRAKIGHVVTAEFDRPNATGPLPVFCEALGVPLAHYPASTQPATPGGFVYFDLPSLSLRDPAENAALQTFLDREQITQRVLVLNAAYDAAALRAASAAGRTVGATHVVFTHLDEVTQWGRLWEFVWDSGLEPLFLSTGPSLSGDCDEQVVAALVRRTLPVADLAVEAEETMEPAELNTTA